jgi:SRSO17 transposase
MKPQELKSLDRRMTEFLEDLLAPMGRSERRHWARIYLEGLLLDGERKSIEPIASRIPGADVQALRQFVGQSPWAVEEVQRRLALKVVDLLSEPEVWIVDDTSFPKAGKHSVGVARQYCGALGKVANCQVAVTLHWSSDETSCPLGWRLYLPEEWVGDSRRTSEVRLSPGTEYTTKTDLALELIDQMLGWELPALPVVADSFYGNDFGFRGELRKRHLFYVVAVEPNTVVWITDPNVPLPPPKSTGRPRKYPPADSLSRPQDLRAVAQQLSAAAWHNIAWREGTKGIQRSRYAMLKVWAAHRWQARDPIERVLEWLLIEWPADEAKPVKYWLGQLGSRPPGIRHFVKIARARWRVELDYRELKDELGLDHFEGRQWLGWYHHVTLVSIAYAFLRSEQLRTKKNSWYDLASSAQESAEGAD